MSEINHINCIIKQKLKNIGIMNKIEPFNQKTKRNYRNI